MQKVISGDKGDTGDMGTIDAYSTTEEVVGIWTDNRPVYKKTFNVNSADGSGDIKILDLSNYNIDLVIDIEGYVLLENSSKREEIQLNYYTGTSYYCRTCYREENGTKGIYQRRKGDGTTLPCTLTLKYVKLNDTPITGIDYWTHQDITILEDYCDDYIDAHITQAIGGSY